MVSEIKICVFIKILGDANGWLIDKIPPYTEAEPKRPLRIMRPGKIIPGKAVLVIRVKGIEVFEAHKTLKAFYPEVEEYIYIRPVVFSRKGILVKKLPGHG